MNDNIEKTPAQLGIPTDEVVRRIRAGMTFREMAEAPVETPRVFAETFEYRGQELTLRELAEISGLKFTTLRNRIRHSGWSIARAVETRVQKNDGRRSRRRRDTDSTHYRKPE
ncbi:MAG: hypothetical protein ACI88C_000092, partial [Acidimicrobiales bacterium]